MDDLPLTFSDAVRLARKLHRELSFGEQGQTVNYETYEFDRSGMLLSKGVSLDCAYITPVAKLVHAIKSRRQVVVKFFKSPDFVNLQGMAVRPNGLKVDVIVPNDATFCAERFTYVKELVHQWEDAYASKETTAKALVRVIESAMRSLSADTIESPLHIENFCFFCALEILLPWGRNGDKRKALLDYRDKGLEDLVIAQAYRVPLTVIQFISQSNYLEVSRKTNNWFDERE